MIVSYNFLIGVLVMLSSEKLAAYAGYLVQPYKERVVRITYVSAFTFGAAFAAISGLIYILFHWLRLSI